MTTLAVAAQIETAETLNPEGPRRTDAGKAEH